MIPNALKIILNIIIYIIYVLIFTLMLSMIISKFIGPVYEPNATYIQLGFAILILFITAVFRKYFYIPLYWNDKNINFKDLEWEIVNNKKTVEKKKIIKTKNWDEDLEIIIWKN